MIQIVQSSIRNMKLWQQGDVRKRWTAAGMLVAEQQFPPASSAPATSPTS
jgi:putative transposase